MDRRLLTAELLSIGTELTVGETRDTNAGELARALTQAGVAIGRITALPDRLDAVADGFASGLARADLVVSTGGLGPTPDDLTREAIAEVCGEEPVVDPELERWLRELWARRGIPFPELNLKQAWLLPSANALPNPNGTAPGWYVTRPDGRVIVALPGPPREMRPMWATHALPRLQAQGLGADVASRTFRTTGIGESQVAVVLGEPLLRQENPEVATYARAEAVDVRISAVGGPDGDAESLVAATAAEVKKKLGDHIWATGDTTWSAAIGSRLRELGWRLASVETGTGGQFAALIGDVDWLAVARIEAARRGAGDRPDPARDGPDANPDPDGALIATAWGAAGSAGAEVGVAIRAVERGADTTVDIAVVTPRTTRTSRRVAFLGGSMGRSRAALLTAAVVLEALRDRS